MGRFFVLNLTKNQKAIAESHFPLTFRDSSGIFLIGIRHHRYNESM